MNWNTLSKHFGEFYEVFLVDQRNHGRSPHDDAHNYGIMADDLVQFFSDNRIKRASVLGHSMGAKTAITFALNYPEMVDKLVAVDMGIKEYAVQDEALQRGLLALDFDLIRSRADADEALAAYIPDLGTRQFIMQNLQWGEDLPAGQAGKSMTWRMNVQAIIDNIEEMGKSIDMDKPYQGETLFVKGSNSDHILPSDYSSILASFPKATIEEIPNSGHWVHVDNPEDFGEVVMRFLKSENSIS